MNIDKFDVFTDLVQNGSARIGKSIFFKWGHAYEVTDWNGNTIEFNDFTTSWDHFCRINGV